MHTGAGSERNSGNGESSRRLELRALRWSMYSALAMAIVGLTFAGLTGSGVILLDGLFNILLFLMVALGISFAGKLNQGPDSAYHFGYGVYEPLLVMVRSALALALTVFAVFDAMQSILHGGAVVDGHLALVYAGILGLGCGALAFYMRRIYRQTGWPTIYSEYITWVMNAAISTSSGVALFFAGWMRGTAFEWVVPYTDPVLMLVMAVVLVQVPYRLFRESFLEIMGRAPADNTRSGTRVGPGVMSSGASVRVISQSRLCPGGSHRSRV